LQREYLSGKQVKVSTLGKIVIGFRGADILFVTDGLRINAPAFVTKTIVQQAKKKANPMVGAFF